MYLIKKQPYYLLYADFFLGSHFQPEDEAVYPTKPLLDFH
jgi:hypothetical protein